MKTYAVIGIGQRAGEFLDALMDDHADEARVVALCDSSPAALEVRAAPYLAKGHDFALYAAEDFDRMLAETTPDEVVVLTPDHTHDAYICRAMQHGCDVICEKPLTTSLDKLQRILDTREATGRRCRVTFNYRYAPWNATIKRELMTGALGRITSVTRRHSFGQVRGAEYFHRWHAQMDCSGGMLVHKSTHYLDLINFYLGSVPKTVYARGQRNVFTPENARALGLAEHGARCADCACAEACPFYRDYRTQGEDLGAVEARGKDTGYYRDLCVFRDDVDVPDTNHVMVEYANGAMLNYSLCTYGARSSDELLIGTHGMMHTTAARPRVTPYYGDPYDLDPPHIAGGHGGGDPEMYRDLLAADPPEDACRRAAGLDDGGWSVLIGFAAYRSMATGEPVVLQDLVRGLDVPAYAQNREVPEGVAVEQLRGWVDDQQRAFGERKVRGALTQEDTFNPQR